MDSNRKSRTTKKQLGDKNRSQLGFEKLEVRLVLSSNSPGAGYNEVLPAWFGTGAPANQSPEPLTSVSDSQLNSEHTSSQADWIIRLTADAVAATAGVEQARQLLSGLPVQVHRGLGLPGALLVSSTTESTSEFIEVLSSTPEIAYFQENRLLVGLASPDDQRFQSLEQYALLNTGQNGGTAGADIDATQAWDITTGSSDVVTAVVDTGIYYTHPDLANNIWTNPGEIPSNNIDDDGNGFIDDVYGWDFHNMDNDPLDDHGHGTHVAGTIAAEGDNSIGVAGVNWTGSVMAIKFLDENNVGTVADAMEAIDYAVMMKKMYDVNVRVINASWGGTGVDDPGLRDSIRAAGEEDILVVAAAGNGDVFGRGQNIDQLPYYPASFDLDNILAVGATDRNDQLTTFSNFGTGTVDIAAPGLSIVSTSIVVENNNSAQTTYSLRSGTSMAAPHVAGTAALLWASSPEATMEEVRQAILDGSDTLTDLQEEIDGGRRLNAFGALVSLAPQSKLITASDVTSVGASSYQFDVEITSNVPIPTANIDDFDFSVVRRDVPNSGIEANNVLKSSSSGGRTWTATYEITPPGGAWDDLDAGFYEIWMQEGQIVDINGNASNQRKIGQFIVNLSSSGVYRPNVEFDGVDDNLLDGIAQTANGDVTLRAAVQEANLQVGPNGGIVILAPGAYRLEIAGGVEDASLTGDLDITGNVTIASDGTGSVIIDAQGNDRVLDVLPGGSLTLEGVTVTGGDATLEDGGGIRNAGVATIRSSTIRDNFSDLDGGGVFNSSTLDLENTTIHNNVASGNGGGLFNALGGDSDVTGSTISNNSANGTTVFDFVPAGGIFGLNSTAAGAQRDAKIAFNSLDEAVAVWTSTDGPTESDIFAQKLTASGALDGPEFQVNDAHTGTVQQPDVAWGNNGSYAVTFEYRFPDPEGFDVGFNSFDGNGPISSGTVRETNQSGYQGRPRIAAADNGDFLLLWYDGAGSDGSGAGALTRVVAPDGTGGSDVVANGFTSGTQIPTSITKLNNGQFVVVWHDGALDGSGLGIYGRILSSSGTPVGSQFLINQTTLGDQQYPDVAATDNGFVVAWYGENGVNARVFDSTGTALTSDISISTQDLTLQSASPISRVSVATLPDDTFVVVWNDVTMRGHNVNRVLMRRIANNGVPLEPEQTVTSQAGFNGIGPTIRASDSGIAYILWDGFTVGDGAGIAAQRFVLMTEATGEGGGIANAGTLDVINSTVSGNSAATDGHGIMNRGTGDIDLLHTTVTQNDGLAAHGVVNASGGTFTLQNSLVAANSLSTSTPDLSGSFATSGGNLVGDLGTATGITDGTNSDQAGDNANPIDPGLKPLADNGGQTLTHALLPGSPAIDSAVTLINLDVDQRGIARPADGDDNGVTAFDIGAVETFFASVTGKKFHDRNSNGVQDPGEEGLPGWTIFLDEDGDGLLDTTEQSVVTAEDDPLTPLVDEAGDYALFSVPPGTYDILEVNQTGWTRTFRSTLYQDEVGSSSVPAIANVSNITISSDGRHAYALNNNSTGADSLVTFSRDALTGELTFVDVLTDGQTDSLGTTVDGLEGDSQLIITVDGKNAYVVSSDDDMLVSFNRDAVTGILTVLDSYTVPTGINDIVQSADGKNIYLLGSTGNALRAYIRDQNTGALFFLGDTAAAGTSLSIPSDGEHLYVTNGSRLTTFKRDTITGALNPTPLSDFGAGEPASGGGTADALSGVSDLLFTSDGIFLYTLSSGDSSVGLYQRNPATGDLAYLEKLDLTGLIDGAASFVLSNSENRLYITGDDLSPLNDGLAVFSREATTGTLTHLETFRQFQPHPTPAGFFTTLGDPHGVAVSPDTRDIYVASASGFLTQFRRDGEGLDRRELAVGEALTEVDFSNFAMPGSIHGAVYDDRNNNSLRDGGEFGLEGVVVYLDLDGSNTFDSTPGSAEEMSSTMTDALGNFSLVDLPTPMDYAVRLALPLNQSVTSPSAAMDREWNVTLDPNEIFIGADFLVHSQLAGASNDISGFVWEDLNGDGVRQGNEPFLEGREVYLDVNDNGSFDIGVDVMAAQPTTMTGDYFFAGLGSASFTVRLITMPGELTSAPVGNEFTRQSLTTGENPVGITAFDFNNDGLLDLATVDQANDTISVRLQQPGGTFASRDIYEVRSQPTDFVVGDFDNDTFPDIAVSHWAVGSIKFLINDGDGTFTPATEEISIDAGESYLAVGDFVPGGGLDLAVSIDRRLGLDDIVQVFSNTNGTVGGFSALAPVPIGDAAPLSLEMGLLNNDSLPDLVVGNFKSDTVQVILNSGGTSFTALTPVPNINGPGAIAIADINNDTHQDLIVANTAINTVTILTGDSTGVLSLDSSFPAGQGPRALTVVDIDDDNDLDVIVGNATDEDIVVLRNENGQFSFAESSGVANFASLVPNGVKQVIATDLDGDQIVDVAAVRGSSGTGAISILLNAQAPGAHRLTVTSNEDVTNRNFGIVGSTTSPSGDYDGDLDVDGSDFLLWQRQFGLTGNQSADGDDSGTVDGADLSIWQQNYPQPLSAVSQLSTAVVISDSAESIKPQADSLAGIPAWADQNLGQLRPLERHRDAAFERESLVRAEYRPAYEEVSADIAHSLRSESDAFFSLGRRSLRPHDEVAPTAALASEIWDDPLDEDL